MSLHPCTVPCVTPGRKQVCRHIYPWRNGSRITRAGVEKPHQCVSGVKHSPVLLHKPECHLPRDAEPTRHCSPVSVLDGQALLHSLHQVSEALGKGLLLGERLAVYQTRPQVTEILLGDGTGVRVLTPNPGLRTAQSARGSEFSEERWPRSTLNLKPREQTTATEAFLGRSPPSSQTPPALIVLLSPSS